MDDSAIAFASAVFIAAEISSLTPIISLPSLVIVEGLMVSRLRPSTHLPLLPFHQGLAGPGV